MKRFLKALSILSILNIGICISCMEDQPTKQSQNEQDTLKIDLIENIPNEVWLIILESNYLDKNILENTEAQDIHQGLAEIKQKLSTYSKIIRLICKTFRSINYGPSVLRDKLRHFYANILSEKFLESRDGGLHPKNGQWGLGADTDSKIASFMLSENKKDLPILIDVIELNCKEEKLKALKNKIIALLSLYHANLDIQDDKGCTPLRATLARYLDSNCNDDENKEIIAMLLANGANVNIPDKDGHNALGPAVTFHYIKDYKEIIAMLLDHGAKVGTDILRMAIHLHNDNTNKRSYKEIIEMLLAHGVDINIPDEDGYIALVRYALSRHGNDNNMEEMIEMLLAHVADVNILDSDGHSPLKNAVFSHYYGSNNYKEIIAKFLAHGANVNIPDKAGKTALSIAVFWHSKYRNHNNKEVIAMLLVYGADVNIPDKEGDTALSLAQENNFHDFDELIKNYSKQGTLKNLCLRVLLTHQKLIEGKLDALPNNLRKLFEFQN